METRPEPTDRGSALSGSWVPLQEAGDGVRGTRAVSRPIGESLAVHLEALGIDARIKRPDPLDETPVTGIAVVGDDDAVKRRFLGAVSGKSDGNHVFLWNSERVARTLVR